jgi:hypothetical protein
MGDEPAAQAESQKIKKKRAISNLNFKSPMENVRTF